MESDDDDKTQFNQRNDEIKLIKSKKYELKYEEDYLILLIETYSDNNVYFKMRKKNHLSLYHYMNCFIYNDLKKFFLSEKEGLNDTSYIFDIFDKLIMNNNIILEYSKEEKLMTLKLKDNDWKIKLYQKKIENNELHYILIDEINEITNNKNKDYENRIKYLEDKIKILEDKINKNMNINGKNEYYCHNNSESINESNINEKEDFIEQKEFLHLNIINICDYISEFEQIRKYFIEKVGKYLMLCTSGNQGNNIIKYFLDKTNNNYIELTRSKFSEDEKNEKYNDEVLENIKHLMTNDNILILKDFDNSLYKIITEKIIPKEDNNNFKLIIIENISNNSDLLNKYFIKEILFFNTFLEKKDFDIIDNFFKYLNIIYSNNNNKNLKIDLEHLLINCKLEDIQGLIFKIKTDMRIKHNSDKNHWIYKEGHEYENNILKYIFEKIVPLFCQDIIISLIYSFLKNKNKEQKYKMMYDVILDIYENSIFYNLESYFKQLKSKRSLIYTFSKEIKSLIRDIKFIKNIFGKFDEENILFLSVESIKKEKDLKKELINFTISKNKKLLIISLKENELNMFYSLKLIIENLEKEYPELKDIIILYIITVERHIKKNVKDEKKIIDSISFLDTDYERILIDNLKGKDNSFIFKIIQKNNNDWHKEYLISKKFIEQNISSVLNYMKYTIIFPTEKLNNNNIIEQISIKILQNMEMKQIILNSLIKHGEKIKLILLIKENFEKYNAKEIYDDIFQNIDNKVKNHFLKLLGNILYYLLKNNILLPFIYNFEISKENEFINRIIMIELNNDLNNINLSMKRNMWYNSNNITIFTNLKIPKSTIYLSKLINYVKNELIKRYLKTESKLRKSLVNEELTNKVINEYNNEIGLYKENIISEINKYELLKVSFQKGNDTFKKLIREEYLHYFIGKCFEKENIGNIGYEMNERIINFVYFILRLKLGKDNISYIFNNSLEEFQTIVLFIQGYEEELKPILRIFLNISKYFPNIEVKMNSILEEYIINYEISPRNKKYSNSVYNSFYFLTEIFIRSILIKSKELINEDKIKFRGLLSDLNMLEKLFLNLNNKFSLFSKEIISFQLLIKIKESCEKNNEQFEINYEGLINNLLNQTNSLYKNNYDKLYQEIIELLQIIDKIFIQKNDDYINLIFYILINHIINIDSDNLRIKLFEYFLKNKLILNKTKILLSITLSEMKPKVLKSNLSSDDLLNDFMVLKIKKAEKFKNIIKYYNEIDSPIFNEVLLYFFEDQCHCYFSEILNNYKNEFTEKCCKDLLLNLSLSYFKKAFDYLDNSVNKSNILKFYAIAYIKTYCYYYVEINYNYYDKCNFNEINKIFSDEYGKNGPIRNLRNLYIWRLYHIKFDNFEKFKNFKFKDKNIPFYDELINKLKLEEENNTKYIFKENFINGTELKDYKTLLNFCEKIIINNNNDYINKMNFDLFNNNFDLFYNILVNNYISFIYGEEKNKYINIMKQLYNATYPYLKLNEEGKILFKYLMNYDLLEKNIFKKISDNPLKQDEFEILLYSLRFLFNTQIQNKNCFYNDLLKENSKHVVNNNFIPGSFPSIDEFERSYLILKEYKGDKFHTGFYICKDCGYLYDVPWCSFPMTKGKCPNNHIIGGNDNVCYKKDLRIFETQKYYDDLVNYWKVPNWINSSENMLLKDFKKNYIDNKKDRIEKGINKNYDVFLFENKPSVRNMHKITYRFLNYLLYSYLLGSYILNNLSENDIKEYLVWNLFPHTLFGIIKRNWELLSIYLKEIGIEKVQIFLNVIFEKIIEIIVEYKSFDSSDIMYELEKKINDFILEKISNKKCIENLNKEYSEWNNSLLNISPKSYKQMIIGEYDPNIYDQKLYPDIQYYSLNIKDNLNTFYNKFLSSKENNSKYVLISTLIYHVIYRSDEFINKIEKMKCLHNINKLTNLLLKKYHFNINRQEAKNKRLIDELPEIEKFYNEIKGENMDKNLVDKFKESWDLIKTKLIGYGNKIWYKCIDFAETPVDINSESSLNYFLVDDGEKGGGMFLASAYENMIYWQNNFLNLIIENNKISGPLNKYISQLEEEIDIQDALPEECLNIDESTYEYFNNLIIKYSMRNIFETDNKINYKNYNDIIYDFDYIEQELGKLILTGKKRFTKNIKFIKYLNEGFTNSDYINILEFISKYGKRELNEKEKKLIFDLIKQNKNDKFYSDIYFSLQVILDVLIKENFAPKKLIYQIITSFPPYLSINEKLKNFLQSCYDNHCDEKLFSIDSLISIFEIFEALCWNMIKKEINPDYKLCIDEETKQRILTYFEENNNKEKIINKINLTSALRKLLSRYHIGERQDLSKNDLQLGLMICKEELWEQNLIENDDFGNELFEILTDKITVGHSFDLYNILEGENILNKYFDEIIFGKSFIEENSQDKIKSNEK